MTPQEMNEAIAGIKGYFRLNDGSWAKHEENGDIFSAPDVPSYTTDWSLCGPLMERLIDADWIPTTAGEYGYEWTDTKPGTTIVYVINKDLKLATCEAFIKELGK